MTAGPYLPTYYVYLGNTPATAWNKFYMTYEGFSSINKQAQQYMKVYNQQAYPDSTSFIQIIKKFPN